TKEPFDYAALVRLVCKQTPIGYTPEIDLTKLCKRQGEQYGNPYYTPTKETIEWLVQQNLEINALSPIEKKQLLHTNFIVFPEKKSFSLALLTNIAEETEGDLDPYTETLMPFLSPITEDHWKAMAYLKKNVQHEDEQSNDNFR